MPVALSREFDYQKNSHADHTKSDMCLVAPLSVVRNKNCKEDAHINLARIDRQAARIIRVISVMMHK